MTDELTTDALTTDARNPPAVPDRRSETTRAALHAACLALPLNPGDGAVQVGELSDLANLVCSTFYGYFQSMVETAVGAIIRASRALAGSLDAGTGSAA